MHWSDAGHYQTSVLSNHVFTRNQPFLSPYHYFLFFLVLLDLPVSFSFPIFACLPKHPVVSLVQSQNTLSLNPIVRTIPLGSDLPQSQRCSGDLFPLTLPDRFHTWPRVCGSPGTALGRARTGCPFIPVPTCLCALVVLCGCVDELSSHNLTPWGVNLYVLTCKFPSLRQCLRASSCYRQIL